MPNQQIYFVPVPTATGKVDYCTVVSGQRTGTTLPTNEKAQRKGRTRLPGTALAASTRSTVVIQI